MSESTATMGWKAAARDIWQSWTPRAIFVTRSCLALFAALWIDFRFDLHSADSVMITVFIISQPLSGLVFSKAYYRLWGTLFGAVGTFIIVIFFAQSRTLFMLALALWLGVCTGLSSLFHDARSYSFVLAGYTSVLFGFFAGLEPYNAIHETIERVTEVCVGIICVGVITDGIFPQRISGKFVAMVRSRSQHLYQGIAGILGQGEMQQQRDVLYKELIQSTQTFESQRGAAVLENPSHRLRSRRLQRLNFDFMLVGSTLWALDKKAQRLGYQTQVAQTLQPLMNDLAQLLETQDGLEHTPEQAEALAERLRQLRASWPRRIAELRQGLPADLHDRFDDAAGLLNQLSAELLAYTRTYASLKNRRMRRPPLRPRYKLYMDWSLAAFNGLRATVSLLIACAFWVMTRWPDEAAVYAVINAGVYPALVANAPDPVKATDSLMKGITVGSIAAVPAGLFVLPRVDGYVMLMASLLVFVIPGFVGLTLPRLAGASLGYLITLALSLNLSNIPGYDPSFIINVGVAQVIGALAAMVAFGVLFPGSRLKSWKRGRKRLRKQLAQLCHLPLRGLRFSFESGIRALLQKQHYGPSLAVMGQGMAAMELGHAILRLRRAALSAGLAPVDKALVQKRLDDLQALFIKPAAADLDALLGQLDRDISQLGESQPAESQASQRVLRLSLVRLHEVLAEPTCRALLDASGGEQYAT